MNRKPAIYFTNESRRCSEWGRTMRLVKKAESRVGMAKNAPTCAGRLAFQSNAIIALVV
jgi:hypothetical protein